MLGSPIILLRFCVVGIGLECIVEQDGWRPVPARGLPETRGVPGHQHIFFENSQISQYRFGGEAEPVICSGALKPLFGKER